MSNNDDIVDVAAIREKAFKALRARGQGLPQEMLDLFKEHGFPMTLSFRVDDAGMVITFIFDGHTDEYPFGPDGQPLKR